MFLTQTDEATATGAVADYFASQRKSWGFLPNYAQCFTTRPDVAQAWATLNLTIRNGMDRRRFELATIAAARARRSTYCTAAHSTFLRDVCGDEATLDSLADDPTGASLDPVDAAVVRFAAQVAGDASSVVQDDVDALLALGLTEADVADIVFAAAARAFFTAVLDGLGAQLDEQTAASLGPRLLSWVVVGRPPAG
ncbi:carboxymuconolactone decarboxylase family protein [Aestuariimicrobium soli]|uniref:carboxymuconolactone decarboxylase family protein n=1 Tax=Aestuariimicrobium soli TaxID=2035834 RepID=UPI003EB73948